MKLKKAMSSGAYSIGQVALGLIVHPYQTLQSVVQEKVFIGMVLLPTAVLAIVTVAWRFFIVPVIQTLFSCSPHHLLACSSLPFFSNWITFFCIYWQILLLYLFFRFSKVFRTR